MNCARDGFSRQPTLTLTKSNGTSVALVKVSYWSMVRGNGTVCLDGRGRRCRLRMRAARACAFPRIFSESLATSPSRLFSRTAKRRLDGHRTRKKLTWTRRTLVHTVLSSSDSLTRRCRYDLVPSEPRLARLGIRARSITVSRLGPHARFIHGSRGKRSRGASVARSVKAPVA